MKPTQVASVLAALDRVQASSLPRVRVKAKPGEITLLRALADAVRADLRAEGTGKHSAGGVAQALAALDLSKDTE